MWVSKFTSFLCVWANRLNLSVCDRNELDFGEGSGIDWIFVWGSKKTGHETVSLGFVCHQGLTSFLYRKLA